ncbi:hypothetical protein CYMTET_3408 [Cymbomonas tetramitiformis]|uniref:Uncharacterized protein n=1 Tax=Cymbomonas tetramitiformis TaxID=36881 RepID=A0AAE0H3C9_9CHLO|nr:hypothetical protein CYMTET_3408 [Cymbomonas tetramitiformis]
MADVHARPPKLRSVSTCPPPAAMCAGVRASLPACNTFAPALQSSANASRSSRAASMGARPPRQCGGAAAEVARPAGWQGGSSGGVAARGAKVAVAVKQQMRCGSRGGMAAGAVRPQRQRAPKFGGSQGGAVALAAASSEEEVMPVMRA